MEGQRNFVTKTKETTLFTLRRRLLHGAMVSCSRLPQWKNELRGRQSNRRIGGLTVLTKLLLLLLGVQLRQLLKVPVGRELGDVRRIHGDRAVGSHDGQLETNE